MCACSASGSRGSGLHRRQRPGDACHERQRVGGNEEYTDAQDGEQGSEAEQDGADPEEHEQRRTLEEAVTYGEDGDAKREATKQRNGERQAPQSLRLRDTDGRARRNSLAVRSG